MAGQNMLDAISRLTTAMVDRLNHMSSLEGPLGSGGPGLDFNPRRFIHETTLPLYDNHQDGIANASTQGVVSVEGSTAQIHTLLSGNVMSTPLIDNAPFKGSVLWYFTGPSRLFFYHPEGTVYEVWLRDNTP